MKFIRLFLTIALLQVVAHAQRYVKQFSTVAEMLASNPVDINTNAFVSGYYVAGDGGGGLYTYNKSSTATTNFGSVLKPNTYTGRWIAQFEGDVNVKRFGAKGDAVHNDTLNINDSFNALPLSVTGQRTGKIFLPAGNFLVNGAISLPSGASISGNGRDSTIVTQLSKTNDTINVVPILGTSAEQSCKISDMWIQCASGSTSGYGINCDATPTNSNMHLIIENVVVNSPFVGIHAKAVTFGNIRNSQVIGAVGDGYFLEQSQNAMLIETSQAYGCGSNGFNVVSCNYSSFISSEAESNTQDGWKLGYDVSKIVCQSFFGGCGSELNGANQFHFILPGSIVMSGIYAQGGTNGIMIEGGQGVDISGYTSYTSTGYGIYNITGPGGAAPCGITVSGRNMYGGLGEIYNTAPVIRVYGNENRNTWSDFVDLRYQDKMIEFSGGTVSVTNSTLSVTGPSGLLVVKTNIIAGTIPDAPLYSGISLNGSMVFSNTTLSSQNWLSVNRDLIINRPTNAWIGLFESGTPQAWFAPVESGSYFQVGTNFMAGVWGGSSSYGSLSLNGSLAKGNANFYSASYLGTNKDLTINRPLDSWIGIAESNTVQAWFVPASSGGGMQLLGNLSIKTVPYTWPASQGGAATYLKNDGSGGLTWATVTSSGGTGTVSSVFARAGDVTASAWDYGANYITNGTSVTGTSVSNALETLNAGKQPTNATLTLVPGAMSISSVTNISTLGQITSFSVVATNQATIHTNILLGEWVPAANVAAISLNGSLDQGSYNFRSEGTAGTAHLYINRPTGRSIWFMENNGATMDLTKTNLSVYGLLSADSITSTNGYNGPAIRTTGTNIAIVGNLSANALTITNNLTVSGTSTFLNATSINASGEGSFNSVIVTNRLTVATNFIVGFPNGGGADYTTDTAISLSGDMNMTNISFWREAGSPSLYINRPLNGTIVFREGNNDTMQMQPGGSTWMYGNFTLKSSTGALYSATGTITNTLSAGSLSVATNVTAATFTGDGSGLTSTGATNQNQLITLSQLQSSVRGGIVSYFDTATPANGFTLGGTTKATNYMSRSVIPATWTNSAVTTANGEYVIAFMSTNTYTSVASGLADVDVYAYENSAGSGAISAEIYLINSVSKIEETQFTPEPPYQTVAAGSTPTLLTFSIPLTDYSSTTNFHLMVKFKVQESGTDPTIRIVSGTAFPSHFSFSVPSTDFVFKSGDTMTGTLVAPNITINTNLSWPAVSPYLGANGTNININWASQGELFYDLPVTAIWLSSVSNAPATTTHTFKSLTLHATNGNCTVYASEITGLKVINNSVTFPVVITNGDFGMFSFGWRGGSNHVAYGYSH